jgi:hypothetical protein
MNANGQLSAEEKDDLRAFARRVEQQILKANRKGMETMERLICRVLSNKRNPVVAATMAHKWVEWRYGKATEHVHMTGSVIHEHVDASKLTDEQLAQAESLVESAYAGTDPG